MRIRSPRAVRRRGELLNNGFGHVELGKLSSQLLHVGDGLRTFVGAENFRQAIADLRREHAEPNFFDFRAGRPEFQKFRRGSRDASSSAR